MFCEMEKKYTWANIKCGNYGRLLLVDDEKLILRGMEETYDWEGMGYEIVGTAMDGDITLGIPTMLKRN